MTPDTKQALLIILVMGLATMSTRLLPVFIFGNKKKVPAFVAYLGNVIPYTAMGLLIVYCLRDVNILSAPHGLPELIAIAVVSLTYLWKRNTILSVVLGTALYMYLVQVVF